MEEVQEEAVVAQIQAARSLPVFAVSMKLHTRQTIETVRKLTGLEVVTQDLGNHQY